jgi:hypothetical protein
MSLEHESPEQRRNKWNTALTGLFKGYSTWLWDLGYPAMFQGEVELDNGRKRNFLIFSGFAQAEYQDEYRPEILVLMSDDAQLRMISRAKWNGEWPEVEGVDTIGGQVTIHAKVEEIKGSGMRLSVVKETQDDLTLDELLEAVNKLALGLRLSRTDLTEQNPQ